MSSRLCPHTVCSNATNNKIVIKYCPAARRSHQVSLGDVRHKHFLAPPPSPLHPPPPPLTRVPACTQAAFFVFFKQTDTFSPTSLLFLSPGDGHDVRTHTMFSGTCQLPTITAIKGLPLLWPPVAAGRSQSRSGGGVAASAAAFCL